MTRPVFRAVALFLAVRTAVLGTFLLAARQAGRQPLRILTGWDGGWYAGIAAHGYGHVTHHPDGRLLSDYAFFPLLPALEHGLGAATGLDYADAGLVISVVASVLTAVALHRIGVLVHGPRTGVLLVLLWAAMPVGAVQWMSYSESLFTAGAAWSLLCVLRRRWIAAGVLALLAGTTRPTATAGVAAVILTTALDLCRDPSRPGSRVLGTLLAPLGLLGYLAYVGWQRGSVTGYFEVARGWHNGFDGGLGFGRWIGAHLAGPTPWQGLVLICAVLVLVALVWWSVRSGQPVVLVTYSIVLLVLAFATTGYFGSKPRYLLAAFPLLLPPAAWLAARRTTCQLGAATALVAVASAYGAMWLLGPGPP
ncbi:MAG: hypothetical protein M3Y66_04275 [Actinomycetota bacterium]|nr:hypothetical protein [Actinomycetota bacterium]